MELSIIDHMISEIYLHRSYGTPHTPQITERGTCNQHGELVRNTGATDIQTMCYIIAAAL